MSVYVGCLFCSLLCMCVSIVNLRLVLSVNNYDWSKKSLFPFHFLFRSCTIYVVRSSFYIWLCLWAATAAVIATNNCTHITCMHMCSLFTYIYVLYEKASDNKYNDTLYWTLVKWNQMEMCHIHSMSCEYIIYTCICVCVYLSVFFFSCK